MAINMSDRTKAFLDELIPENLSKKKKNALYIELAAHISDLADHYFDLGMTREESEIAALKDFGNDEMIKKSIYSEFESLYHEKTWWALVPAALILLLNISCLCSQVFVASGDFVGNPDIGKTAISFLMIFINIALTFAAISLHFWKSLIGIGTANLLIGASVLMCAYPQCALWAIEENIYYLIERFTPIVLPDVLKNGSVFFFWLSIAFCLLLFVCCLVSAIKIKRKSNKNKSINKGRIKAKALILTAVFLLIAVASCVIPLISEAWF